MNQTLKVLKDVLAITRAFLQLVEQAGLSNLPDAMDLSLACQSIDDGVAAVEAVSSEARQKSTLDSYRASIQGAVDKIPFAAAGIVMGGLPPQVDADLKTRITDMYYEQINPLRKKIRV